MKFFNIRNSHRQRIGKARTKLGLKPTLAELRDDLNRRRCDEHGPDFRGMHESGDGRFYVWHTTAFIPGEPLAPPGTAMLSDVVGGPW